MLEKIERKTDSISINIKISTAKKKSKEKQQQNLNININNNLKKQHNVNRKVPLLVKRCQKQRTTNRQTNGRTDRHSDKLSNNLTNNVFCRYLCLCCWYLSFTCLSKGCCRFHTDIYRYTKTGGEAKKKTSTTKVNKP